MAKKTENAIRVIVEAAKNYEKYLNNRKFLIIYKTKDGQDFVEVAFHSVNFLHLTGVKSKLTAQRFYEACIANRLSGEDFSFDTSGKTERKLLVLPKLHELLYHNCMIGDFINSGIMIRADYFVGDTKLVLSLGFRHDKNIDFPVTLYSGDVRKLANPTNKVLVIYSKKQAEIVYKDKTFVAKGVNPADLSVQGLPAVDNTEENNNQD